MSKEDFWTDEQEKRLLEVCKFSHRIGDVARALEPVRQGVTRNAVIGKIGRMRKRGHVIKMDQDLDGKSDGSPQIAIGHPPRRSPPPKAARHPEPTPRRGVQARDSGRAEPTPEMIPMRKLSLLELGPRTCRWPVGDVGEPAFFFCGNDTDADRVYCSVHYVVAHYRTTNR